MPTENALAVFLFSFAVSFGAVISPGPVSAAIVSEGPRQGWRVGPLVALGHSFLEGIIVILIGYGLSTGLASAGIQRGIALLGGFVLLWIGGGYLWRVRQGSLELPQPGINEPDRNALSLIGLGLATTLSNPFWYAWWVTVAAGYLAQAQALGAAGVAIFYVGHISADFFWDSFLAGAVSWGGRWLTNRRYQALIVITGGFLIYLGFNFFRVGLGLA
jgi:threonine/homoserine/homoserine lactone efflux protein